MLKKMISCVAAMALALGTVAELPASLLINENSITVASAASTETVYDLNTLPTFKRTREEIGKKYADAVYADSSYVNGDDDTYYTVPASTEAPYNEGVLTQDTVTVMQELTNFYRYLVGVQPLKAKCVPSPYLQYQALDRNFVFSHYIDDSDKPADMSKELWDKGSTLRHNILAWGYTPSGAITGWMNEGYDLDDGTWSSFGHRYALINDNVSGIQFGYCGITAIGHDVEYENDNMKEIAYAFPAPGYMPDSLVAPYECGWSLDFDTDKLTAENDDDVTVTITNLRTKKTFKRTSADNTLTVSYSSLHFVQPDDYDTSTYRYTDNYKVEIAGLKDAGGKNAKIVYEVDFFDITDYQNSYVVSASAESFDHLVIYESMKDTASLKKVAAILPTNVNVTAESGKKCTVPITAKWTLDEKNKCFRTKADASKLPKILNDKNGVLNNVKISYEISSDYFDQFNSLTIYPSEITEGQSTRFSVYLTNTSCDRSSIYKITANGDGTYSGVKRFDNLTSPEFNKKDSDIDHNYDLKNAKLSDSGEYISIYFYSSGWWNDAYVCIQPQKLTVSHNYKVTTTPATCTKDGSKTYTCTVCGDSYTKVIPKTGHKYTNKVTAPTYDSQGYTTHTCSLCGDSYTDSYTEKLVRQSIASVSVSGIINKHYTGKALTQKLVVKLGGKTLKSGTDYTLTYKNNKAVGKATVTITGKGGYTGRITKSFKICPPKTSLTALTSPKTKQIKAVYTKVNDVTGYQITYSTSAKFTKAATKSVNVKGTSKTISKLTKGKSYYVKVRTYKTVNGTKYYSGYSAVKKIKVK